jgi:hypothetical protein
MAYRKVDCRVWADAKFARLSDEAKLLWFYLMTCPETTSLPGVIVAGPAGMAEALGWDLKGFGKGFGELFREGLAKASWQPPRNGSEVAFGKGRLVWLPNAWKYNRPENPNVVLGWGKHWDVVPECPLKDEIYQVLESFTKGLGKGFAEAFRKGCPKGSPNGLANQDPDPEQEQEPFQREIHDAASGPCDPIPAEPVTPKRTRAAKPEKPAPEPTGFVQVRDCWFQVFESNRGCKPAFDARDGKAINTLLAKLGEQRACEAIRNAFTDSWWAANRASLPDLASNPNPHLGAKPRINGKQGLLQPSAGKQWGETAQAPTEAEWSEFEKKGLF